MSQRNFIRLSRLALVFSVAVIVWGAVVRATGSGAGCGSHWPLCNGEFVPLAPKVATTIEFAHRTTSGIAMLLALAMAVGARFAFPAGHRVRVWALASLVFMLIEAAVGAGLVLLGLVEQNASVARAIYIAVHLTNTMILVAAMTGTIWWASRPVDRSASVVRSRGLFVTMILMIGVAASGAVVALGDTLFPAESLRQGLSADLNPTAHFLIRLRVFHPFLAAGAALILIAQIRRDPTFARADGASRGALLLTFLLMQLGLGAVNLLLLAPLTLQMAHLLVSNLLWIALVWSWLDGQDASLDRDRRARDAAAAIARFD